MRNLIAAVYFLLALFGCESGGTTVVSHSVVNGVDIIHARTRIKAGIARFECLASASGECHYTLFPSQCASTGDDCARKPIDRFAMRAGESREIVGLPRFEPCVAQDDASMNSDCRPTNGTAQ
jgi:hypothetical protein